MASLCSSAGGRLIQISRTNNASPISISLSYGDGPTQLTRLGVAVSVQADQKVQAQFQNALNDAIFVTPFGDAPGQIRVTFVANRLCRDSGAGFEVIQHYLDRRLRPGNTSSKDPATVTIGPGAFRAFLTSILISGNTSDTPIVQGTLVFTAWPS